MIAFCHSCGSWQNVFWCEDCPDWECSKCRYGLHHKEVFCMEDFYDTSLILDKPTKPWISGYCNHCERFFELINNNVEAFNGFMGGCVIEITCPKCHNKVVL